MHRCPNGRSVKSKLQASRFVEEVGFCFVFPVGGSELPSLGCALDPASPSQLRELIPDERCAYRGKLLLSRPMLVSREYLPFFVVLMGLQEASLGHRSSRRALSPIAQAILEQLRKRAPQSSRALRGRIGQSGKAGRGAFESALVELQVNLQVAAVVDDQSIPASSWALVRKLYAREVRKARSISIEEARRAILERHFRNQLVLTVAEIRHVFRWERQAIFQTLGELIRRGVITPEVQVDGIAARTYCLLT
jgi:hypothetical protein